MQLPNKTLGFLIEELRSPTEGSHLKKIQALPQSAFRFRLATKDGTKDLTVTANALFFSSYHLPATDEHKGFVEFLRSRIEGKRILGIRQQGNDRIAVASIGEFELVFELFAKGNIVLIDSNHQTIGCLRREQWKDREIAPKKPYTFPASKSDPAELTETEFASRLQASDKNIVQSLVLEFNLFPPFAEEIVLSAKLDNPKASELTAKQKQILHRQLIQFSCKAPTPILIQTKTETILSPHALPGACQKNGWTTKPVPDFNSSLDDFFSSQLSDNATVQEESKAESKQEKRLEIRQTELGTSQAKFEQSIQENQQKAEWIYTHYGELSELFKALHQAHAKKLSDSDVLQKLKIAGTTKSLCRKIVQVSVQKKSVVLEI